ncbi:DUF1861 family protein [Cohnella sp. AR92]|uniref:DUF1861 family protein n=1 Tax=Cohnella sp. AR92 TaxID=648716 RepID=UPI000F8D0736|nr:DUF1861 family protein [Cohnella sp. AR92]RUS43272.1 DUF1861 family protein [Cohnella sp. AR92]
MQASIGQAKSCAVLFEQFKQERRERRGKEVQGEKLTFSGVGGRDVYNITAPFPDDGEQVIAGRVEDRSSERSQVMFFVERGGEWVPRSHAPVFDLQDPFVAFIRGELVFGGVEVYFDGEDPHYVTSWRTVFYRGYRIADLQPFAKGPLTMKDIRLVELKNGRIGVFTRPMPVGDARAMIGYTDIGELEELTEDRLENADVIPGQFLKVEWGGGNEAHLLRNGRIGVLGHIACMDDGNIRHYYPMAFGFDPQSRTATPIRIIASRDMFPDGPAKRLDLVDVLFSGGLVRHGDGTATLYSGVSDAEAHRIEIEDPFLEYEK